MKEQVQLRREHEQNEEPFKRGKILSVYPMESFVFFKLDFKVGWKKLKEVFSIAGTVKRADIKEDKDGKSRGMGTVTFEQPIEAVQAICILASQSDQRAMLSGFVCVSKLKTLFLPYLTSERAWLPVNSASSLSF